MKNRSESTSRSTIRSTMILISICAIVTGCGANPVEAFCAMILPPPVTVPREVEQCPANPQIDFQKQGEGYFISSDDIKKLMHYVADVEEKAECQIRN